MHFEYIDTPPAIAKFSLSKLRTRFRNSVFYDVIIEEDCLLYRILKEYPNKFVPSYFKIIGNLNPHTDFESKAGINWYINTGNCETNFFDVVRVGETISERSTRYNLDNLELNSSFKSKNRDIWLLDVDCPHSVNFLTYPISFRDGLTLSTNKFNFQEVSAIIKELK
jgi:hypothetical protein